MRLSSIHSLALLQFIVLVLGGCVGRGNDDATTPPRNQRGITVVKDLTSAPASIAFDAAYTYVSTAGVVYRTELPLSASSSLLALDAGPCALVSIPEISARPAQLVRFQSTLYLINPDTHDAQGFEPEHSVCVSTDRGASFVAMDQGLKTCFDGWCKYLSGDQLKVVNDRVYFNGGGAPNLLVSTVGGQAWSAILGSLEGRMCYTQSFEIVGRKLLVGGECPLDFAFLRAFRLRDDLLALESATPEPVTLPDLGNRNIQFIKAIDGTPYVFAGVEGGLLRSIDSGATFQFVIKYDAGAPAAYPYIQHIAWSSPLSSQNPVAMLVGGFNKADGKPWLAYSSDWGGTWKDITAQLPHFSKVASNKVSAVTFIAEDPSGRFLVGVSLNDGQLSYIAEVPAEGA